MALAYLHLGGNQGDTQAILASANDDLIAGSCTILAASQYYLTEAWGMEDQADFINQALYISTKYTALELLQFIHGIEDKYGRKRTLRWGPRTLDIDILFYDDLILDSKELTLPHPRLHERNFVLIPLMEIAPDKIHPVFQKSIRELYLDSTDKNNVQLLRKG